MLNALAHHSSSAMKSAVASRSFRSVADFVHRQNTTLPNSTDTGAAWSDGICGDSFKSAVRELTASVHTSYERTRKEKWASQIEAQNELCTAQQLVDAKTPLEFIGRLMTSCPTRGGGVWESLVALLCGADPGTPLLESKVRAILTGKMSIEVSSAAPAGYSSIAAKARHEVIANGTSWIHCPLDRALLLREVVGEEAFLEIETSMRGVSGWVYRESDIPNRHGHCNSHPNPALTRRFDSFAARAERERR
mmetsp:Transcript_6585/g.11611  ORF Transcript_6585/g.11611 Transcript_6585/m.11611 type:complete len:250 (+) Transcript_6585:711-1460(+)